MKNITIILVLAGLGIFLYFDTKEPVKREHFNTITPTPSNVTAKNALESIKIEYVSSKTSLSKVVVSPDKDQKTIDPIFNEETIKIIRKNGELYAIDTDGNNMAVPLAPDSKEIYTVDTDGNDMAVPLVLLAPE